MLQWNLNERYCQSHKLIDIGAILNDAQHLLRNYDIVLSSHALQTYSSTLATMPHCGLLDTCHNIDIRGPRLMTARSVAWDTRYLVMQGHTARANAVAFSPDGLRMASGSINGGVKLWDIATSQQIIPLELSEDGNYVDLVTAIAFSQNGTQLVSGSLLRYVQVWDVSTGQCISFFEVTDGASVASLAISAGSCCITAVGMTNEDIRLWDMETE